jgi:hypothetical protein
VALDQDHVAGRVAHRQVHTLGDRFVKGEARQILFVAVLFGLGLYRIGERAQPRIDISIRLRKSSSAPLETIRQCRRATSVTLAYEDVLHGGAR